VIVKIKSYKTPRFFKLLDYIMEKKEKFLNREGKSFVILHNVRGKGIEEWAKQFKKNEEYRVNKRKNQVYLTQEIISFHNEEHVSLEKMEDIAREYIRQRNPNGMYVAVPHFDKQYHIHICAAAIEYRTGKSLRMSKGQFQKLKQNIQRYQLEKYPELSKSVVRHGSKKSPALSDKEFQLKLRTGRETNKETLIGILKTCYKKANSKESFFELAQECGLEIYSRGGRISGVHFANKKFRLKRIGFTEERLDELNKHQKREHELTKIRGRKGKNREHDI
jgi:hypothetical protein